MREMWRHRGMRLVFTANLVSMIGSGMNSAAVIWYILQATHSEVSLGTLTALQTLPSVLLLPLTGVLIDREDRRHVMMALDAARGIIIFAVALLVFTHRVHLWHLYLMSILVAMGFWMFFPTVNALVQELTPDDKLLDSNALLLAALQGGWVMAGAVVGFVYNRVGLGGVLLIDCASYLVSLACVFQVRKGRVLVAKPPHPATEGDVSSSVDRFMHELGEGYRYVHENRRVFLIGIAWALFVAAMMTQGVITAPLSERILHAGAIGYGWLNAGWAIGALASTFYASRLVRRRGANHVVTFTMATIAASLFILPVSRWLALAVPIYFIMGSSRGMGGIALSSEMMQLVPRHFMGRVQNAFSIVAGTLQVGMSLLVGEAAHRDGLIFGFCLVGTMYLGAALTAWLPMRSVPVTVPGHDISTAD